MIKIKKTNFEIVKGKLKATGEYKNESERKEMSDITSQVSQRWQFEVLGIITELMGYTVTITQNGEDFLLEAEEEGKTHPCRYIRISKKKGNTTVTFEHFKSADELKLESAKFLKLAYKMGIYIELDDSNIEKGDPMPDEVVHIHKDKNSNEN